MARDEKEIARIMSELNLNNKQTIVDFMHLVQECWVSCRRAATEIQRVMSAPAEGTEQLSKPITLTEHFNMIEDLIEENYAKKGLIPSLTEVKEMIAPILMRKWQGKINPNFLKEDIERTYYHIFG